MPFCEGWVYRPDAIAASVERMTSDGLLVASAGKSFSGEWSRRVSAGETAFLACTVEDGEPPAYCQSTGVCTSMLYRSLQDCLNWEIKKFGGVGKSVSIAFEPIFAGSRIAIGRGQLGYGDGSIGAWIAEFVARYGAILRGMYTNVDLSRPREDLAQAWGRPGVGVPTNIQDLGKVHRFRAHKAESTDEIADGMASGCFGGICRSNYTHSIDSGGFARFDNRGGHHTCLRGAFVDRRTNRRVFVEQQTHGSGVPDPHPIAHTTDGDVELSDGAYLVREDDIQRYLAAGEVWLFQPILGEEFR